jgi:uncharacterized protein (TIGR03085 family)
MARYAQDERQALADLFLSVGPDAATLCEGWTTRDLAAHLVVRERRPDAAPGLVVPMLAPYLERVQRSVGTGRSWPALVETVRSGPPALLRPVDEQLNAVEYFVHHEDVRRASAGWQPRQLDPGLESALWSRVPLLARMVRRRMPPGTLTLEAPGHGSRTVGAGEPHVTLEGPPSELVLFLTGRQAASRAVATGPADAVERLRQARLGA